MNTAEQQRGSRFSHNSTEDCPVCEQVAWCSASAVVPKCNTLSWLGTEKTSVPTATRLETCAGKVGTPHGVQSPCGLHQTPRSNGPRVKFRPNIKGLCKSKVSKSSKVDRTCTYEHLVLAWPARRLKPGANKSVLNQGPILLPLTRSEAEDK